MRVEEYYQVSTDETVLLFFVSKAAAEHMVKSLSLIERTIVESHGFSGQLGEVCCIRDAQGKLQKVYIGAGDDQWMRSIEASIERLPAGAYRTDHALPHAALVAWSLAQYRFDHYKENTLAPRVLAVQQRLLSSIILDASAVCRVRDLINMPTNAMGPTQFSCVMQSIAKEQGAVFEEWVDDALLQANFPAIHAVGRAAKDAPRLLALTWGKEDHPRVTLVGKGVCFDSGGLDIKNASGMRLMKKDMGGAAHAIGLAEWIMRRQLPIRLRVLIPAVENAISADAYRPGDVLTMRNGLHVEIENTDAEGRLVLADALTKACEEKSELIIDFATLTGAARVALGTEIAVMFSNEDQVADEIMQASRDVADPVWRLPLFSDYRSLFDSSIADMRNASESGYAGAITAALFLERFVEKTPWIHFDIMAWNIANRPGRPIGGEAMAMRAVSEFLVRRYAPTLDLL